MYSQPQNISDPYIRASLASYAGTGVTMVQVISNYRMLDSRTESLVEAIRSTAPPPTMHILVDGATAGIIDYVNTLYDAFPLALLVVAAVTYLVLMVVFRSLRITAQGYPDEFPLDTGQLWRAGAHLPGRQFAPAAQLHTARICGSLIAHTDVLRALWPLNGLRGFSARHEYVKPMSRPETISAALPRGWSAAGAS